MGHDTKIDIEDDDEREEANTTPPFQPQASSTPGNTTQPFQPQAASTPGATASPYHGGEAHEVSEFGFEQSGMSDTTSLLQPQADQTWAYVKAVIPDADGEFIETSMEVDPNPDPKSKKKP